MTLLAKSFMIPVLSWVGLILPTVAQAQSGSRSAPRPPVNQGIAVVELFTSQGCSSCPPADKVLQRIATAARENNLAVFALSFHVDYWNRLGWTDPYSDASFSQRQRSYAGAMKSNRVYTPQMIVNGTTEFVGSRRTQANQAISKSLRRGAKATIAATLNNNAPDRLVDFQYQLSGQTNGKILNVAVVETPQSTSVPRGENAGRDLSHVNVVRVFRSIPINRTSGNLSLELPDDLDPSAIQVIAYVQDPKTLMISGATAVN